MALNHIHYRLVLTCVSGVHIKIQSHSSTEQAFLTAIYTISSSSHMNCMAIIVIVTIVKLFLALNFTVQLCTFFPHGHAVLIRLAELCIAPVMSRCGK